MKEEFIGRIEEITILTHLLNLKNQSNILIYGKRRIGKTELIKHVLKSFSSKNIIHYQATTSNETIIVKEISSIIKDSLKLDYEPSFNCFSDLLEFLFKQEDIILVLDEYNYLINSIPNINSIIQQKIDKYKSSSNLKLILSGSAMKIMESLQSYSNPLFGRFQKTILLKEMDYLESSLFYPTFSNEDKVKFYATFGGEPSFNALIDSSLSFEENLYKICLSKISTMKLFFENLMMIELNSIKNTSTVLTLIGKGIKKHNEIATKANIDSSSLSKILDKLEELDIVEKRTPINDKSNKKKTLYFIKNPLFSFYFTFIFSNRNINYLSGKDFYLSFIKESFEKDYVPHIFEDISRQFLILMNKNNMLEEPFFDIGTYRFDDKINKINRQYDIVTNTKSGFNYYEVKFWNKEITKKIIDEEIEQINSSDLKPNKIYFISKNKIDVEETNKLSFFNINDIYNINLLDFKKNL